MKPKILILILTSALIAKSEKYFNENDIPELTYLDPSTNPCDNFYQFTCGNFAKIHPRPSTLNVLDHFTLLENELIQVGQEILSSPVKENDPKAVKKAKTAYKSCVQSQVLNNVVPELRTVKEFGGMPLLSSSNNQTISFSWNEVGKLVSEYGVPLIFVYSVAQKSQNESMIVLSWDTLNNPTLFRQVLQKTYDHVLEEDFAKFGTSRVTRSTSPQPFDIFLETVAKNLLKYTNPEKPEGEVLDELDEMATFMRTLYKGGIKGSTILPLPSEVTLGQLQEWTYQQFGEAVIDWVQYLGLVFQKSGVKITPMTKLYHQDIERIYGILNLVKKTDPKVLKNFALLRVFLFQAPDSGSATRQAFEKYYQAKNNQLYPRWEYCTRKILDVVDTASLSYAVTYNYLQYHFSTEKLAQVTQMIENIREVFSETLNASDWMDEESREQALKKATNMLVLLGYPDFVQDQDTLDQFYAKFRVCERDNYGNARTIRAFKQAYQFTQLGKLDRLFWGKSAFDANAYYNRPNNKIVVPLSMLNPVFFHGGNPVVDYSRLGSIIGHEMTHGFDVNGKNYDQDGTLSTWWSQKTTDAFNERSECFKKQYSQYYVPEIGLYVNGSYCINENLADNGGIRQSYKAFESLAKAQKIKSNGNYTLEQLFFIGYGTMWCSDESNYALSVIVNTVNGYPPKRYRVIGSLANMVEFAEAFNCPVGSTMNPEEKCQLW
ncbi:membrane metallo-endopeptidase-like 1 [Tribolium castaneum]|uniref:Membrane metallo-endopeptidase-like 1 n=1 Tax=Tribolium castaneum TaxID=7070 RepID=D2A4X8_TRICA|nr:Membrane metallo-endopeptidase-like 1 [Tribolium castaneum]